MTLRDAQQGRSSGPFRPSHPAVSGLRSFSLNSALLATTVSSCLLASSLLPVSFSATAKWYRIRGSVAAGAAGLAQQGHAALRVAGGGQDPAQRISRLRAGRQHIGLARQRLRLRVIALLLIDPGQVIQRHGSCGFCLSNISRYFDCVVELLRGDIDLGQLLRRDEVVRVLSQPVQQQRVGVIGSAGPQQRAGQASHQ